MDYTTEAYAAAKALSYAVSEGGFASTEALAKVGLQPTKLTPPLKLRYMRSAIVDFNIEHF